MEKSKNDKIIISYEWDRIVREIHQNKSWQDVLIVKRQQATIPDLGDINLIIGKLASYFNDKKMGFSVDIARIALFINATKVIRAIRRTGTLRASKYTFETAQIRHFIGTLLTDKEFFKFDDEDLIYFKSILAISDIADEIKIIRLKVLKDSRPISHQIIKSLLVNVDKAFLPINEVINNDATQPQYDDISKSLSIECKAVGFSTLLAMLIKVFKSSDVDTAIINRKMIIDGAANEFILNGFYINEYREIETLIDSFPYSASKENGKVIVKALDNKLEKAIRLGYVQTNMQALVRHYYFVNDKDTKLESIETFASFMYHELGQSIVELVSNPIKRYKIKVPFTPQTKKIFSGDKLFKEDIGYLYGLAIDGFVNIDWLMMAVIIDDITVLDFVKVKRLFTFLYFIQKHALENHSARSDFVEVDLLSRVPVFHKNELERMIGLCVNENKVCRIIDFLTYDTKSNEYFDVQYTPIIKFNDYCMFSLGVIANTNIVRNFLYERSKKIIYPNNCDPMQNAIENGLLKNNFKVTKNLRRKSKENDIEIDLLAYLDGKLFIFECKNPFHPCGIHELRTSYDHIQKGSKQLTKIENWIKAENVQGSLFKELQWKVDAAEEIYTCILNANRMFNGYEIDGHPIRQAHEFLNILGTGEIRLGESYYSVWKSGNFNSSELIDYLGTSHLIGLQLENLVSIDNYHTIGNSILIRKSYGLNMASVQQNASELFEKITEEQYEENIKNNHLSPANMVNATLKNI